MRPLSWEEYPSNFDSWSESTRNSYVSRIISFGDNADVAWIASALTTESASSKLINMALDAGARFDKNDIFLLEFSINEETLNRMKATADNRLLRRQQKKQNKEAFWSGDAQTEFFDTLIDEMFNKK